MGCFCLTTIHFPSSDKSSSIFIWHQGWRHNVGHRVGRGLPGTTTWRGPIWAQSPPQGKQSWQGESESWWRGSASAFCSTFELSSYVHQINPFFCVSLLSCVPGAYEQKESWLTQTLKAEAELFLGSHVGPPSSRGPFILFLARDKQTFLL